MLSVTKEITFDMAHMLANHNGLCKNLHGHTYKLLVEVIRHENGWYKTIETDASREGMVIDFHDLKAVLEAIKSEYDHATVLWANTNDAFEMALINLISTCNKKHVLMSERTTCENMAASMFTFIDNLIQAGVGPDEGTLELRKVRLYETPTSYAEVVREDDDE